MYVECEKGGALSRSGSSETAGFKTRMKIVDALAALSSDQRIEDITIDRLCERAGVCRSTFYYHFEDKYDVIQWHFDVVASSCLDEIGRTLTWRQGYLKHTREVLRMGNLYPAAFRERGYQSIFSYVKRHRREKIRETLTRHKNLEIDDELDFQIFALSEVEVGSMEYWFKKGMPYDMNRQCDYLENVVPRRLHALLNEPVDPLPW